MMTVTTAVNPKRGWLKAAPGLDDGESEIRESVNVARKKRKIKDNKKQKQNKESKIVVMHTAAVKWPDSASVEKKKKTK